MPSGGTRSKKPAIGLNCDIKLRTTAKRQKLEIYREYADSVELAGGVPIVLPVTDSADHVDEQLDLVDGLVLIGGDDYSPQSYGVRKHQKTKTLHKSREFYDIELARAAIRRKIPILGICGGLQLVNIVCGGDLVQHIPEAFGTAIQHDRNREEIAHEVVIAPNSILARTVGAERLAVNSSHHQAAGRIGAGLRVAARSADGVVEALESESGVLRLCVQWHPERLAARRPDQLALFEALIAASREQPDIA